MAPWWTVLAEDTENVENAFEQGWSYYLFLYILQGGPWTSLKNLSNDIHLHAKESAEEVDVDDDLDELCVDQGNAHLVPLCTPSSSDQGGFDANYPPRLGREGLHSCPSDQ